METVIMLTRMRRAGRIMALSLFFAASSMTTVPAAPLTGPGTPAFVVDGGTQVRLSGTTRLTLDCDLRNAGAFLPDPGSAVVLNGYGAPLLTGVGTFADLTLELHGTAALASPATVAGSLTLSAGRLSLAGHDLSAAAIAGGSASSYVMTPDSLGRLVRTVGSAAAVRFPVGHAAYDPVTVRTEVGTDVFRIAVVDSPATTGLTPSTALVRAWAVSYTNPPGTNGGVTYTVQWNAGEEGAQFDRSLDPSTGAWAWRWLDGAWVPQPNVRRSDNAIYPAVDSLVTPDAGLWTLGGVGALLGSERPGEEVPRRLELAAAFPNPSRGATRLRYGLPARLRVRLELYSVLGERIATLADGVQEPGWHLVRYVNARLASGMYFIRLQAGADVRTAKLVLAQ